MELFKFEKEEVKAPIIFPEMEKVELEINDFLDKPEYHAYKCTILAPGEFAGKEYVLFMTNRNKFAQKQYREFLKPYFTQEELENGNWTPIKLMKTKVSAIAEKAREYNGKLIQNLHTWTVINNSDATPF